MARRVLVVQDPQAHRLDGQDPRRAARLRLRRLVLKLTGQPPFPYTVYRHAQKQSAGTNGWLDMYGMMSVNKLRFFTGAAREEVLSKSAYDDLELPTDLHRWHPFHRQMYLGARIMLPGHLLASQGRPGGDALVGRDALRVPRRGRDRVHGEAPPALEAARRVRRDKFVERKVAERWLPKEVAWRRKQMFRAPDGHAGRTHRAARHDWIDQVLSPESLQKAGYFDPAAVAAARREAGEDPAAALARTEPGDGPDGVTATQLWHHLYIGGDLCELPSKVESRNVECPSMGPRRPTIRV